MYELSISAQFEKWYLKKVYRSIQDKVKLITRRCVKVHIQQIQIAVLLIFGLILTYKQVRDALFRLRMTLWPVKHLGSGWYTLDYNIL